MCNSNIFVSLQKFCTHKIDKIMKLKLQTLKLLFCLIGGSIYAQNEATIPYYHYFEDDNENVNWVLQNGTTDNQWVIGSAVSNSPNRALYISDNGGISAQYTSVSNTLCAYRIFNTVDGEDYEVSFDWIANGESGYDDLRVFWVDNPDVDVTAWTSNFYIIPTIATPFQKYNIMQNNSDWTHGSFTISGNGLPAKLLFLWRNDYLYQYQPGGCVDNIEIEKLCPRPIININTDYLSWFNISWTNVGDFYILRYRNTGVTETWTNISTYSPDTAFDFTNPTPGHYEIEVQSYCSDGQSLWAKTNTIIFDTLLNCIDFTNLTGLTTTCTHGDFDNPYATRGVIDSGQYSILSRHTVNTIQDTDPRTDNLLNVIPQGEQYSVRLGNWASGGYAESVTYYYIPNAFSSILLLRYAVVLQDPNHTPTDQPRFRLEILDENNQLINPICGTADFIPGTNTDDWHTTNTDVVWKDWTTIGLNISDYLGQLIQVRFTTYDCGFSAHFGYAYFTLSCAPAELQGASCGGIPAEFIAPIGFNYQWYPENNPSQIVSTTNTFVNQANDITDYICRMEYLENDACFFTLKALTKNRLPYAAAIPILDTLGCRNCVSFQNTSYVTIGNVITEDAIQTFDWTTNNGQTSTEENPVLLLPNQGGTYTVTLVAGLANRMCTDTIFFSLTVPNKPVLDTILHIATCIDNPYFFYNQYLNQSGVYYDTLPSTNGGCDSTITLYLTVNQGVVTTFIDEICQGEIYNLHGFNEETAGIYTQNLQTINGCDSTITLYLTANQKAATTFIDEICQGETYNLHGFNEETTGIYTQNLQTVNGCDSTITLYLTVNQGVVTTFIDEICQGETYNLHGFNEETTGIYTQNLQTVNGCDSIITLYLTVNPVYDEIIIAQIYQDETYNEYGFNENNTGIYTQNLQTIDGCDSTITLNLKVNQPPVLIVFPNTITPSNADGINDYFYLPAANEVLELSIYIYNRWGECVFTSNNPYFRWDGKVRDQVMQGIYTYVCTYRNREREERNITGIVTVL